MLGLDTSTQGVETMKASSRPVLTEHQTTLSSVEISLCLGKTLTALLKAGSSWGSEYASLPNFGLLVPITARRTTSGANDYHPIQ